MRLYYQLSLVVWFFDCLNWKCNSPYWWALFVSICLTFFLLYHFVSFLKHFWSCWQPTVLNMDFAREEDAMLAVDTCVLNSPSLGDDLRGPTLVPTTSRVVPMMCCPDDTVKKVRPPAKQVTKQKVVPIVKKVRKQCRCIVSPRPPPLKPNIQGLLKLPTTPVCPRRIRVGVDFCGQTPRQPWRTFHLCVAYDLHPMFLDHASVVVA